MPDVQDPIIRIENLCKTYPGGVKAVDNVSIDVARGEFFALLGPSGCGKTTLLRTMAGFEVPTSGILTIDGKDMAGVPPNNRPVNMVFQSYAVFPHMTVAQNVGYGLRIEGRPRREIADRVEDALGLVELDGLGTRMPDELSGGQRQRVALARALIKRPSVLLLDEPLSALDAKLREAMQLELVRLQQTVGITFIIVTHDQDEALSMANRIAVMEQGVVRQVAGPAELYESPNSRFVADFIGKINLFEGTASTAGGGRTRVETPILASLDLEADADGAVTLGVRPEKIYVTRDKPDDTMVAAHGSVTNIAYYGGYSKVFVDIGAGEPILADITNARRSADLGFKNGDQVWISWRARDTLVLPA